MGCFSLVNTLRLFIFKLKKYLFHTELDNSQLRGFFFSLPRAKLVTKMTVYVFAQHFQ